MGVDEAAIDNAGGGVPWDHLRQYPADGTFVGTSGDGRVYEIVGGAPLYVSNWNAVGGPKATIGIDQWDVNNTSDPHAHLRQYPADGTFVGTSGDGRVYEIVGGAPLYVSNWNAVGGPKATIGIDQWDVNNTSDPHAHLRQYPADGTFVGTSGDGRVYEIVGGAPLYVSNWNAVGGPKATIGIDQWDVNNTSDPHAHLRQYPADGTFINTSTGRVYRIAGGAPIYVSSWSVFGGVKPYVNVDQWDVNNTSDPHAHLLAAPLDGTVVEGLPSSQFWSFHSGLRSPVAANPQAVAVDDVGLAAFQVAQSASPTSEKHRHKHRHGRGHGPKHGHRRRRHRRIVLGWSGFAQNGKGFGTARPSVIFNGGDPSGLVTHIRWKHWGRRVAPGRGLNAIFKPHGGYYRRLAHIRLRASDIGICQRSGRHAYLRLSVRVPSHPGGPLGPWQSWSDAKTLC